MNQPVTDTTDHAILIEKLPFEIDGGIASRAAIGLILLTTDCRCMLRLTKARIPWSPESHPN